MPSPFETTLRRECTINGIPRCIPLGTFCRFQALATTNHVPFPVNRLFLNPLQSDLQFQRPTYGFLRLYYGYPT
ncbi:hypothetical protein PC121_g8350 [Phytophthora cactorum]|nr:hypothetical protein PC120_g20060 [Phytophthora cactorum]KAG3074407.1 hypothetical protein PC121_g8350 [Phytophthora cactorum]KAG4043952.1 hypothetical protein PC123_g20585 [Phytophthora cactorum]